MTIRYRTRKDRANARSVVADHLAAGGLVAYPTETVYGLGCTVKPEPLARLAAFKNRDVDTRPFLLLVAGAGDVPGLLWTDPARALADRFWPGPLTLALETAGAWPTQVVGPGNTVAVRCSPHPAVTALLDAASGPITSTSANRPGDEPARTARAAEAAVRGLEPTLVLDGGPLPASAPSTIVECLARGTRVVRDGAVNRDEIAATVKLMEDG